MIQQTSINSYIEVKNNYTFSNNQAKVYNCLKEMVSATDREICDALGILDPNQVRPRRKELCDLGLIGEECKRECSITHKQVIAWKVLE